MDALSIIKVHVYAHTCRYILVSVKWFYVKYLNEPLWVHLNNNTFNILIKLNSLITYFQICIVLA